MRVKYSWFGLLIALLALLVAAPAAAQLELKASASTTAADCAIGRGKTCFHVFTSTHTGTTGDSVVFQVNMCSVVSYYFNGDGAASLRVKENNANSTSGATVVEYDWDGDGLVTGDEMIAVDGSVGSRSFAVRPKAPFQYVDVLTPPSSGSVSLAITCY